MKRRTQQCIAAFAITGIVIGALCGFVLVDLSTDRYLPTAEYAPLFQVAAINADEVLLDALGSRYRIESAELDGARETAWRLRGFLPHSVTLTGNVVSRAYIALWEHAREQGGWNLPETE